MGKFIILLVVLMLIVGGISMAKNTFTSTSNSTPSLIKSIGDETSSLPGLPTRSSVSSNSSSSTTPETITSIDSNQQTTSVRPQLVEEVLVGYPIPGQKVKSPIVVTGSASGAWFKNGEFTVRLLDENGQVISEAAAEAKGDWVVSGLVPFKATLPYELSGENHVGRLILRSANSRTTTSGQTSMEIIINLF